MSFLRDSIRLMANKETADFYDAEVLVVYWETKPEIIARLLPPPLKPFNKPLVSAFIADYPSTNFGVTYKEAALFLTCEFDGVEGGYCLAMPVTNDMAMALGREVLGFPKKIAKIYFNREKREAVGWAERHGTRFIEIKAKLNGRPNSSDFIQLFTERTSGGAGTDILSVSYNYKHFISPDGEYFDYTPRLVKQETVLRPTELKLGNAKISIKSSVNDPWGEVEIERIMGAVYIKGNNSMFKGSVVAELEQEKFVPYSFLKWDSEI
ncbi:MAG: acetoacetate decarboxylase family protein [Promethearchaeota archaeon]